MKYLNNKICEFKLLFNNFNPNIKKNIVSCAFFKLMTSPYKNFNLYIDGLEKLYNKVYNKYADENFTIRLFIDKSIYSDEKLYDRLKKMDKIELVLYSCINYQIGDNLEYHMGLFGTLVRFFPMFNFENNDADIIIISDIDDYDYFEKSIQNIKLIKSHIKSHTNLSFFKAGNISKNVLYTITSVYKNIPNPYAIASNFISFSKCDYQVIYDFLIEIGESNELLTKYQHKFASNTNLITGDKFIYGFDEYFLNINYTNFLIDTSNTICVKFKWSVYGSLFWYLSKKNIPQYQIDLINNILKHIYKKINQNFTNNHNIFEKFKILDKMIYKNNLLSEKILYEFYYFFISVENDDRYSFLFEKNIYKLIKKYDLFGIYDFEIITFSSSNSEYFNFVYKKVFSLEQINKLKKVHNSNLLSRNINIQTKNNIDKIEDIDCNIIFKNNLSLNPHIWVNVFDLNGKIVVLKKEIFETNTNTNEYDFYIKYSKQIKNDNFDIYILLPIRDIKKCENKEHNKLWYIYTFNNLNWDYNCEFISKINFKKWLEYTIEICLILYYLNNYIGIYHNDLCYKNDLRNIMIKKNSIIKNIKVDDYNFKVINDYPVIIDFGHQSKEPMKRTWNFYYADDKKKYKFKYISEVFIVYYYSFKIYFKFEDYWDSKFANFYLPIQKKCSSLKEFDKYILNNLLEMYDKNN
jgi:hypothetical protein